MNKHLDPQRGILPSKIGTIIKFKNDIKYTCLEAKENAHTIIATKSVYENTISDLKATIEELNEENKRLSREITFFNHSMYPNLLFNTKKD